MVENVKVELALYEFRQILVLHVGHSVYGQTNREVLQR